MQVVSRLVNHVYWNWIDCLQPLIMKAISRLVNYVYWYMYWIDCLQPLIMNVISRLVKYVYLNWIDSLEPLIVKAISRLVNYVYWNSELCISNQLWTFTSFLLRDQYLQSWKSDMQNSPKGFYYNILKRSLEFEKYLLLPGTISKPILKFRTSHHNLPIETGR